MSFTWDWLLLRMIDTGILDYYQVNVCADNTSNMVLYKLGRAAGALLTECHIIHRTSKHCFRISSFVVDVVTSSSCASADELCTYIITRFVPNYIKPKTAKEKLVQLKAEREGKSPYERKLAIASESVRVRNSAATQTIVTDDELLESTPWYRSMRNRS